MSRTPRCQQHGHPYQSTLQVRQRPQGRPGIRLQAKSEEQTARQGQGKKKEEESKDSSDMDEDVDPKHAAKSDDKGKNPFAKKAPVYHTFLSTPTVRQQKTSPRILMVTLPPVPQYLRWSEVPITWDRKDLPDLIPTENQYAMVINPLIDGVEFTKYMVDSGVGVRSMENKKFLPHEH